MTAHLVTALLDNIVIIAAVSNTSKWYLMMVHKPLKKVHPLSQKYKVLLAMKKLRSSPGDIWIVGVPVESVNLTYNT